MRSVTTVSVEITFSKLRYRYQVRGCDNAVKRRRVSLARSMATCLAYRWSWRKKELGDGDREWGEGGAGTLTVAVPAIKLPQGGGGSGSRPCVSEEKKMRKL